MTLKQRFMQMFNELPKQARRELIFDAYGNNPMTLIICYIEIKCNTKLGKRILKRLGYV